MKLPSQKNHGQTVTLALAFGIGFCTVRCIEYGGRAMSGYEKSPDYGNPPPLTWQQWTKGGLILAGVVAFVAVTFLV